MWGRKRRHLGVTPWISIQQSSYNKTSFSNRKARTSKLSRCVVGFHFILLCWPFSPSRRTHRLVLKYGLFYCTNMKDSVINELKSAYGLNGHKTVINGDTLSLFKQFKDPTKMMLQLGIITDQGTPIKCSMACSSCSTEVIKRHTASSLSIVMNTVDGKFHPLAVLCDSCSKAQDEEVAMDIVLSDLAEKLHRYVSVAPKNAKPEDILHDFDSITKFGSYYQRALSAELIAMDYDEFLKTRYWAAVALKVKFEGRDMCIGCNSFSHPLDCHHKTYERHGMEHFFWKSDLVPLCRECHQREHQLHPALRSPLPIGEKKISSHYLPF